MTTPTQCFTIGCQHTDVEPREYDWWCEPRAKRDKPEEEPYWTVFTINLCSSCYNKTEDCEFVTGWDWWDAADHLDFSYLQSDAYRDHYDQVNANILGFASIKDLRKARAQNLDKIGETKIEIPTQNE